MVVGGRDLNRRTDFEIIPNEISLIVANFVNTVLYAIGASVALAFAGIANLESFSLGTILYWAQDNNSLEGGDWWWWIPPIVIIIVLFTGLFLMAVGLDEFANQRLRRRA